MGVGLGGVHRYGLIVEGFDGPWSVEVTVGTLRFADLAVSGAVKRYFRSDTPNPYVGAGLWLVTARGPAGRRGLAAVLRVPVGLDWRVTGRHHLGAEVNVHRALWVHRTDPLDDRPIRGRLVPLPGLYYRFRTSG